MAAYRFQLIAARDITLAMNVTMLVKPMTVQTVSENCQPPTRMVKIVTGMLTRDTRISAVDRHNSKAFDNVLSAGDKQTTTHRAKLPMTATMRIKQRMAASASLSVDVIVAFSLAGAVVVIWAEGELRIITESFIFDTGYPTRASRYQCVENSFMLLSDVSVVVVVNFTEGKARNRH